MKVLVIALVLVLALAAGATGLYLHNSSGATGEFETAKIQRGDVAATISSTGTLEPEEVIDVGAQVAGLVQSFGTDADGKPIDYRSRVKTDMVLANIDPSVYQTDVATADAELAQAYVSVTKGKADLSQAKAKQTQADRLWARAQKMGPSDALSQNDYEMYQADDETAHANVDVANAEIEQGNASVKGAQASLAKAKRNLDFCTIKSPVDGVIIDRRVNIGQTVVSSLNAPSLFLIAKDLSHMQIWVAVNEADIGRINPGTPVTFTCDAFPDRVFKAKVGKVRWNATMTQNVVMYTVEVETDNPNNMLLPYLSARVTFEVQRDRDVLYVPNAALRWYPVSASEVVPEARSSWKPVTEDAPAPESRGAGSPKHNKKAEKPSKERHGTVWVKDGQFVKPVDVKLGVTDGTSTAIFADQISDKDEVVTGEAVQSSQDHNSNPFMPHFGRH